VLEAGVTNSAAEAGPFAVGRGRLRDRTFSSVFSNIFVYSILYEDSEVDERFLEIDTDSTILGISGAGCRIAGHVSQHPRSIDAVDINLGCPVKKVVKCNGGSGLLRDLPLVERLLRAVRAAITIPLTMKFRSVSASEK